MSTKSTISKLATTAMLSAVASVLMVIQFSVPLMPPFIKMDFSELPALLATFSMGPIYGVAVCFIKNAFHALFSTTFCVGELSNFLLGCCLVIPAGLIYRSRKSRKRALIGSLVGALAMAAISIPVNYFISYRVYMIFMPLEAIIGTYQAILPSVDSLVTCLVIFNFPFNFLKGMLTATLTFFIYKPLSPLLHK